LLSEHQSLPTVTCQPPLNYAIVCWCLSSCSEKRNHRIAIWGHMGTTRCKFQPSWLPLFTFLGRRKTEFITRFRDEGIFMFTQNRFKVGNKAAILV